MTGENPSCLLVKGGGWQTSVGDAICGCVPSDKAGTSNYWSHLWTHHRLVWYELKRRHGALNPAGEAAMAKLKEGLANRAAGTQVNHGIRGEQFLSPNLSSDRRRSCVVVDISDIAIISVIPDMVKGMISGITNTPQTTYRIAQ